MYRIMIADDEEIECRALELMVRNCFSELEIVPEAHNGIELLANLEKYKPDIAIVDINMPGINGLEALEIIRIKNRRLKIMIHTAYSDFEFSQRALKLGVEEYILKPVTQDDFAVALRKIVMRLKEESRVSWENEKILRISQDMQLIVGDQILTSFILKEAEEKNFRIYCQALEHSFTGAVFCIMRLEEEADYKNEAKLRQVREIADRQLQKFTNYVIRIHQGEIYILLLPGAHINEENYREWTENIFGIILKKARIITENRIIIGCSKWKKDFSSMQYGVSECRLQLKKAGKREAISFYQEELQVAESGTEKQILEEILALMKDWEQNKEETETKIFERMKAGREGLAAQGVLCGSVLLELLSRREKRSSVTGSYHMERTFDWRGLLNPGTEAELRKAFHENLEKASQADLMTGGGNIHVERTVLFLEERYNQDITLEMAAENTGITPFYLSRLLRQELDRTFVEILTEIRMRKAMSLLQNKMISVKDTAALVGFQNYTYFYKSFKKYTGISVGEYRASFFV